jgi:hypothetical protein
MVAMSRDPSKIFPIICCLALAGCGKPMATTPMNQLNPGTTTVQKAVAALGEPTGTEPGRNGTSILTWDPTRVPYAGDGTPAVIRLTFGPDGKLLDENVAKVDPMSVPELDGP